MCPNIDGDPHERTPLRAQVYGKEAPSVTIDTKEFLPAAPKGSGDEEAMGRRAALFPPSNNT